MTQDEKWLLKYNEVVTTSLRMQKLIENYVVSNAKIKAALGMTAMPVRAVDGLRGTIRLLEIHRVGRLFWA